MLTRLTTMEPALECLSFLPESWTHRNLQRRKETTYSLEPVGQKNQPGPTTVLYGLALAFALIAGAVIGSLFDEQGKRPGDIFKKQFKSKIGVALLSVGCASGVFFRPRCWRKRSGLKISHCQHP